MVGNREVGPQVLSFGVDRIQWNFEPMRNHAEKCCLVPNGDFRTIAKYAKPPYNEILVSGSPTMLGPVAQESVVDSALLRSIFRPFKPAFLYTTCTQSLARNVHITSGLPVICPETYKSRFSRDRGVAEMVGKDTGAASANEQTTRIEVLQ